MYNCEIYSVLKNQADTDSLNEKIDSIASDLYNHDLRVVFNTNIAPDPKAISKALFKSESSDESPDYNIFVNALDTTDAESFKSLFYHFIKSSEEQIVPNEDNKDKKAKVKICSLKDLGNGYKGYCFKIFDKHYIVLPLASLCNTEVDVLISQAIERANKIFDENKDELPDGLTFIDAPKQKKEGFFKSFIPHKTDSKNTKIRKWVVLIAIVAFLVAAVYLVNTLIIQPLKNQQITSEIHNIAYSHLSDNPDDPNLPAQNWDALKELNKEIVGWVTIKGTKIDYPVLEHKGDSEYSQYYLNRTYKKSYSAYGSVFLDYRSTDSVKSKNVIMHGHNMTDGSMFHSLVDYGALKGNLDYYKKHPVIEFNTPEGDQSYKIISVFKTNTLFDHGEFFNYMQGTFLSDAEFMNFVYNCRIRSLINCPVMVNEDDQIITLSTCSYEFTNWRTVVVARKVREGENASVDTSLATLNSKPVFPDIYYQRNGGTRPEVLTFKTANSQGLINWYDGKGNLEGSEELTETVKVNPTYPTDAQGNTIPPKNIYEVKFVNWDGTEYYTVNVTEGSSVELPSGTPGLPSDEYYDYTFTGWQTKGLDLKNVHYSMTIYPDFKATLKQ